MGRCQSDVVASRIHHVSGGRIVRRLLRRNVCGIVAGLALAVAPAFADQRDFVLTNSTGADLVEAHVRPSGQVDWGENVLRDNLGNGGSVTVSSARFTPGDCLYDIMVVTDEGNEGALSQVNLCEATTVTFYPG
jgi:hypothetical protein